MGARAASAGRYGHGAVHQIAVPAHYGVRANQESQPVENLAGQRGQESGQKSPVFGCESHSGVGTELAFQDGDLVTQDEDLHVFVPIAHGQQPQRGKGVRDGQIGQAKEHSRSSCRTRYRLPGGPELAYAKQSPRRVMTWTDVIVGRRTVAVGGELVDVTTSEGISGPGVEVGGPGGDCALEHLPGNVGQTVSHVAGPDDEDTLVAQRGEAGSEVPGAGRGRRWAG